MNGRQRVHALIAGEPADTCGFWLGNPHEDIWPALESYFGVSTDEDLRHVLDDDFRWIPPHHVPGFYQHPRGRAVFDLGFEKTAHGQEGPFANATDPKEVEDYEWPDIEYLNVDVTLAELRKADGAYRASGYWTQYYIDIMDLFGMQNYLIKMYTHPEVVHAVTDRVCDFYYQANEQLFKAAGDEIDGYFFGNDMGTQLDLISGPKQFEEFLKPWMKTFTDQGHRYGYQVILHSCGSVYKIIDQLIDIGIDCLHPLQARARNMDAETLAREFKGRIAFLGGVDVQRILPYGTPEEVRAEVHRVRRLLEPQLIISPSHEKVLPDVPPENIEMLARAAKEPI